MNIVGTIRVVLILLFVVSCNMNNKSEFSSNLEPLLSDYKNIDVGEVGIAGFIMVQDSLVNISVSGNDIWGSSDSFHYLYKSVFGDFDIRFRVHTFEAADLYSKIGIMARNDLKSDSQHVFFLLFSDNAERNNNNGGFEFQHRSSKGGITKAIYPALSDEQNIGLVEFPNMWIRLKRKNDQIESLFSYDNIVWVSYSMIEIKMPHDLFLGIAMTSHNNNKLSSAVFSNLEIK